MSLFKKTYTVSERDAEIAAARRTWSECDPLLVHLLGKSEQDYLDEVAANCPLATPEISEPRALTLTEKAAVDAEQNLATIFGGIYRDRECSSIPAIAALERAEEQNSFAKVFGRQPSVQTPFDEMLKAAIQEAATELKKRYDRAPLAVPTSGAPSTHLGGRVEFDSDAGECTEYSSSGAFLRSWAGPPSARPAFEAMAARR